MEKSTPLRETDTRRPPGSRPRDDLPDPGRHCVVRPPGPARRRIRSGPAETAYDASHVALAEGARGGPFLRPATPRWLIGIGFTPIFRGL